MHDTLRKLHGGRNATGTAIEGYRMNEVVSQIAFGGRRRGTYRRIVALAGVRSGDSVLDVGCSSGYLARMLATAAGPGGRVTGVDPAATAIEWARQNSGPALTFTVGAAQDLPLPDSQFDVVTCTLAMHHVPARKRGTALAQMFRVTKPGGRLLVADFEPTRMPLLLRLGGQRTRRAAATVGPLDDLARAAGYQVESTGRLPLMRYVIAVRPVTP